MKINYLKKFALIWAVFLIPCLAFAQTGNINGKVVDEKNQAMPGVSISIAGTTKGASTDQSGKFSITNVQPGTYVVISQFLGYINSKQTVTLGTSDININFGLQPSAKDLNEVVVVGYGTVKKTDLTGAVAVITAKDFNQGAITTPEELIQGKVAGVSIISNSGAPGAGSTIRIRGGASISGSNDPLIVLDGVPLSNNTIKGAANSLDLINPNDIESFSILKDASSAAIYGNRASNGVILITTKKGQAGKPIINFNTQFSIASLPHEAKVLSPDQFRTFINAHDTTSAGFYKKFLGTSSTDWQKQIFQTSYSTNNNLSVSGKAGKLPYRVSAGYMNQNGILKTSSLNRYTAAINLSPSLFTDHLKLNFNANGAQVKNRFADEGAIGSAVSMNPSVPVYSGNANYGGYWQWLDSNNGPTFLKSNTPKNPVGLLNQRDNRSTVYRTIANLQADYKFHFFPDLHANVNIAYDGSKGSGKDYISDSSASKYLKSYQDSAHVYHGGQNNQYREANSNKLFEGFLNYDKELKNIKSHFNVVAGYSFQAFSTTVFNYANYFSDGVKQPNSTPNYAQSISQNSLRSYYGRLIYAYDNKYLLTATVRRDGSSKFAPGLRYGTFPSIALGWKINQEAFLKNSTVLSTLKLRVEYGVTGNQDGIGNYDYLADYSLSTPTASYQFGNSYVQGYRPAAYYFGRTWEQTATSNIGLDYGFLNDRISGSIDVFDRKTKNLLAVIGQAAGSNFSNQITGNVGNMENKGIEFNINTLIVQTTDISWNLNFNITYNQNKVTSLNGVAYPGLPSGGISGGTGSTIQATTVGYPVHSYLVYQQVYAANGRPIDNLFVDRNGDGQINDHDRYFYKSPDPKTYLGLNSNVSFKKWNAGFSARASLGNYVYNNVASNTGVTSNFLQTVSNGFINNGSTAVLTSNLIGNTANDRLSDFYVENGSFLRMDNIHIGYTFGKLFNNSCELKMSANVNNAFVITKYTGADPEISNGIDNNFYPRPRTFVLGLNLSIR